MDMLVYSSWFDDVAISDGYSGAVLFYGKISTFTDTKSDGTIATKRTLNVPPGTVMPEHKVLSYLGEYWLIGDSIADALQGQAIRESYGMKKVLSQFRLCTPGQAALGRGGTNIFMQPDYIHSTPDTISTSAISPFFNLYMSTAEKVSAGYFAIHPDGTHYRIKARYDLLEGFRIAQADQVQDGCVVEVIVGSQTYDPVTELATGNLKATQGIKIAAYQAYEYQTQADPKIAAADQILILANTFTVVVGQVLNVAGVTYKVISVTPELDAIKILLRLM